MVELECNFRQINGNTILQLLLIPNIKQHKKVEEAMQCDWSASPRGFFLSLSYWGKRKIC